MAEKTQVKVRSWGNSLGIILPKEAAASEMLAVDDIIEIKIVKDKTMKPLFGMLKRSKNDVKDYVGSKVKNG